MTAVFTAALIARHSDKAVSVNGEKKDDGTTVIQWPFQDGGHQKWNLEATTGGYFLVRAVHSGKALSVEGESTADGAKVIQWGAVSGPHQEWRLVQKDNGFFALQNRHSEKFLSVNAESVDNGAALGSGRVGTPLTSSSASASTRGPSGWPCGTSVRPAQRPRRRQRCVGQRVSLGACALIQAV